MCRGTEQGVGCGAIELHRLSHPWLPREFGVLSMRHNVASVSARSTEIDEFAAAQAKVANRLGK